ncbi:cell division regulator GpsB [Shouchella patagoniensis]|uniref:cell division regulator GpsB n=1 Tax=Shouchella patagoniensis TaxID=228576 RepID=UPI000994E4AD|nr:cell division regulator GpsB [Shouchella patagoniensis]
MSTVEIKLTAKEILNKDFKVGMRGYSQEEVDKFLDSVIQDYEAFQKKVELLEKENEHLKQEVKRQVERPQRSQPVSQPTAGSTNYDILQRLSNLEKKVFGSKMYE